MSVNTVLAGLGSKIEIGGREYDLLPLTIKQHAEVGAWIETNLRIAHRRSRLNYTQDEWDRLGKQINEDIGLQLYAFPQPAYFKALMTQQGLSKAIFICLRDQNFPVTEEEVVTAVAKKMDDIIQLFLEANADPTSGESLTAS